MNPDEPTILFVGNGNNSLCSNKTSSNNKTEVTSTISQEVSKKLTL